MEFEYTITKEDMKYITRLFLKSIYMTKKNLFFQFFIILFLFLFVFKEGYYLFGVLISIFSYFLLFLFYYYYIPGKSAKNFIDVNLCLEIDDDFINTKTENSSGIVKITYYDNYNLYGNILTLYKSKFGAQKFLLYKLSQSDQEELISIISTKIPLKK